ncbi:hypothetical protein [Flavobacterium sp. J27]|uniref:hypothetical protein n=1 Tax=Flavobacterium sp. J27 TaxID=2060419 RepID=UPI0013EE9B95|nr:hypothetical protein [Flavobacterium sp. J27]
MNATVKQYLVRTKNAYFENNGQSIGECFEKVIHSAKKEDIAKVKLYTSIHYQLKNR